MSPSSPPSSSPSSPRRRATSVLKHVFTAVLALVILFEEWGWEPLQQLLGQPGSSRSPSQRCCA